MPPRTESSVPAAKRKYTKRAPFWGGTVAPLEQSPVLATPAEAPGLDVEYVCRHNPAHRETVRALSYDKERCCVFCDCLMSVTVDKEIPCTEPM